MLVPSSKGCWDERPGPSLQGGVWVAFWDRSLAGCYSRICLNAASARSAILPNHNDLMGFAGVFAYP